MKKIGSLFLSIPCKINELNLSISLQNGQSFRWQEASPGVWRGMIREGVWSFAQDDANLYCVLHNLPLDGEISAEASSKKVSVNQNSKSSKKSTKKCTSDVGDASRRQRSRLSRELSDVEEAISDVVLSAVKQEPQTYSIVESCNYSSPSPKRLKRLKTKENCDIKPTSDFSITSNRSIHEAKPQSSCPLFSKYQCSYTSSNTSPDVANHYLDIVHQYFRLDVDLTSAYKDWCVRDVNFQVAAQKCPGVRLLDQPPVENLFSFICSSNNNIARISSLVEKLCVAFGCEECEVDGHKWCSFPAIEALASEGVEEKLRTLGFGYRAAYIHQSALALLAKGGEAWLLELRRASREECRQKLRSLPGVGPKVADCISLMSLDKLESIPVDTHVFQIAARHYLPHLRQTKTVTPRVYDAVTHHFQQLYGHRAGWAHSVLFSADLKKFGAH